MILEEINFLLYLLDRIIMSIITLTSIETLKIIWGIAITKNISLKRGMHK